MQFIVCAAWKMATNGILNEELFFDQVGGWFEGSKFSEIYLYTYMNIKFVINNKQRSVSSSQSKRRAFMLCFDGQVAHTRDGCAATNLQTAASF